MTTEKPLRLYEVFIQPKPGQSHEHCGSVHAPDAEMALQNARDVYTRRLEGRSIWVVPSEHITANSPSEEEFFFDPSNDKIYRTPMFYNTGAVKI